jgi:4-amino-4-deoxy-L-arabinose transferase-like glycosyltransferase
MLKPFLILALAMVGLVVLVPPGGEFPIDIDWNYARVVQTLVDQGQLEVSPWTAASLVFQVYWGALFVKAFGFSHTVLRTSTLVLGAAGVVGFYLLLRRLVDPALALLGALLLLFNPLFVGLAYSFKTNVPCLALTVWSLYCYVRAIDATDRGGPPGVRPRILLGWLVAGSILAGAAFLVRQISVALPIAVGIVMLFRTRWPFAPRRWSGYGWPWRQSLVVAGSFLPLMLLGIWIVRSRGPSRQESIAWTLRFWENLGDRLVMVLLSRLGETVATLGLFALPIALGMLASWSALRLGWRRAWGGMTLVLIGLLGFLIRADESWDALLFPFLGNTLDAGGFYVANQHYYAGTTPETVVLPTLGRMLISLLALAGAALLVLAAVAVCSWQRLRGPSGVPLLSGLIALGLTMPYYSFYDDYLLALLPVALLVASLAANRVARSIGPPLRGAQRWLIEPTLGFGALDAVDCWRVPAVAGVLLLAVWSIWWERDYLQRQTAVWQAGQALVKQGIAPEAIDGGFEWNGWYRGQAVIAAAAERSTGPRLQTRIFRDLHMPDAQYVLRFTPPLGAATEHVLAAVPYGGKRYVYAVQTY